MIRKPKIVLSPRIKDESSSYQRSYCVELFLPAEDHSPKEAMEEVRAAFDEHIRDEHSMEPA